MALSEAGLEELPFVECCKQFNKRSGLACSVGWIKRSALKGLLIIDGSSDPKCNKTLP